MMVMHIYVYIFSGWIWVDQSQVNSSVFDDEIWPILWVSAARFRGEELSDDDIQVLRPKIVL